MGVIDCQRSNHACTLLVGSECMLCLLSLVMTRKRRSYSAVIQQAPALPRSAPWCADACSDPQNVPSALFGLGYMYLAGYGVVLDHRKAFKYFSQAAEQARLLPPRAAVYGLLSPQF